LDFHWTPQRIEHYRQASEYTAFHKKLSVLVQPYLDTKWTLADLGCGPGFLDFHLAPMVAEITAVDCDPGAISALDAELDARFYTNQRRVTEKIHTRLGDALALEGQSWDVVLLSFFGLNDGLLRKLLPLARRRALIFMHAHNVSPGFEGFGASVPSNRDDKFSSDELERWLQNENYSFKKTVMEMQFGQPFKTIEDIHTFLDGLSGSQTGGGSCTSLGAAGTDAKPGGDAIRRRADAEERIVKTDRFDYPFYLPRSIRVALFIVAMKSGGDAL